MEVFDRYPYLGGTILAAAILSAFALSLTVGRRICFFSGGLHAFSAIFAYTLDPYYTPAKLGGLKVGIEDFLFGFAAGLAVWLLATFSATARSLSIPWRTRPILMRIGVFAVLAPVPYFGLGALGVDPMSALDASLLLLGVLAIGLRPWLWRLAVPAALAYPVVHGLAVAFAFAVWPDLPTVWNSEHFWGARVLLGVPLGEVAWAAVFGFAWPPVVAVLLDARQAGDGTGPIG